MVKCTMVIASSTCTQLWAMVTLSSLLLLWEWPKLWHCIRLSTCVLFSTMKFPLLVNLVCNNFKHSDGFELDVIVDGDRWTYYDLGYMYDMWIEILQDFTDYRDYMGLSSMVWLCKWSLLGLISYNLGGSVTEFTVQFLYMFFNSPYYPNKLRKALNKSIWS